MDGVVDSELRLHPFVRIDIGDPCVDIEVLLTSISRVLYNGGIILHGRLEVAPDVKSAIMHLSSVHWFDWMRTHGVDAQTMARAYCREMREQAREVPWHLEECACKNGDQPDAFVIDPNVLVDDYRPSKNDRDIVVFPRTHDVKRTFSHSDMFWDVYNLIRQKLGARVSKVVFNFGQWENGQYANPHALYCHARAHILLTEDGGQVMRMRDVIELEQQRVIGHELLRMEDARMGGMDRMDATLDRMDATVDRMVDRMVGMESTLERILNLLQQAMDDGILQMRKNVG